MYSYLPEVKECNISFFVCKRTKIIKLSNGFETIFSSYSSSASSAANGKTFGFKSGRDDQFVINKTIIRSIPTEYRNTKKETNICTLLFQFKFKSYENK